jgi:hypothetical protein
VVSPAATLLEGAVANVGRVHRVGNTVRRPVAPHRQATHSVLRHLAQVGFPGAPKLLDFDEHYERLSWIPGQAACSPLPEWALGADQLVSVAELVRDFHRAVASYRPAGAQLWPTPVPDRYRSEDISHNDLHPGNIIFSGGEAVGLIDFDLAGPGGRIWDLATLLRCWSPLVADVDLPTSLRAGMGGDARIERAAMLLDAYGLAGPDRLAVADALLDNHDWTYRIVMVAAAAGHRGFGEYWQAVASQTGRARAWLAQALPALRAAVS